MNIDEAITDKPLEWKELWGAMDKNPDTWISTTGNMFEEMLGAVPPQDMAAGGFLVGEPNSHNAKGEAVYACFLEHPTLGSFEARYMTQREFNQYKSIRR